MAQRSEEEEAVQELDYTMDGSIDLKGNPVFRSKRGGWTACYFIVVYEVFERMAYYGISSNLVIYLTKKLHQGTVTSANNVTNWVGAGFLTTIFGAYVADAHLGRYWTFIIASALYLAGMCLLTITVSVPPLKPPHCEQGKAADCKPASALQLGVFFGALYMLALGAGGTKPNISTMGADQFDEFSPKERAHKISFFNWWMFSIYMGTLFANIILVYIQDNVGWTLGYAIPTLGLAVSLLIFVAGTPFYRHKAPQGSPFTRMARVLVASMRKWRVEVPKDSKELHELELEEYTKRRRFKISPTSCMRFLNKAAVKVEPATPWTLCSVTDVEETKQMMKMTPIWVAMFVPAIMIAQVNTLYIKQGTTLNRHISSKFEIPPASLSSFVTISMLISIVVYDRYLVKALRRWTKNRRGITLLQRIGIGLLLHVVIMLVASLAERTRLRTAREHGLVENGGKVPLTIFILLPQFTLMGIADAFTVVGKIEFFYDQAPESMKSLGTSYSLATYGIGNFLSSGVLAFVSNVTKRNGGKGWILDNLNESHLDYYYAFLSILSLCNFVFFLFVCKLYVYKAELFESVEAKELEDIKSS